MKVKLEISNLKIEFIVLLFLVFGFDAKTQSEIFPTKTIIDTVKCSANDEQSYALYLPSNYSEEKEWPVIIVLEPVARGKLGAQVFESSAEEFGYIVIASNNSRNGLYENNYQAFDAIWFDIHKRFNIDINRVYLSGFSGGARAAWAIAIKSQVITGIIGCGAALPSMYQGRPEQKDKIVFVGLVGDKDMNYQEMHDLQQYLDKMEIENALFIFEAGHQWPPPKVITEAFEWLEINAMKKNIIQKEENFISVIEKKRLAKVDSLIKTEDWVQAMATYKGLQRVLSFIKEPNYLNEQMALLAASKEYKSASKRMNAIKIEEEQYQTKLIKAAGKLILPTEDSDSLLSWWTSEIVTLKRKERSKNALKSKMASRLLNLISAMSFQSSENKVEELDYVAAKLLIKLSIKVSPNNFWYLYNLARIECLNGEHNATFKTLEKAIDLGIPSVRWLKHPAFNSIRDADEFQQLLMKFD